MCQGENRTPQRRREEPVSPCCVGRGQVRRRKRALDDCTMEKGYVGVVELRCLWRGVQSTLTFNSSMNLSLKSTLFLNSWGLRDMKLLYLGEHQVNMEIVLIDSGATR